MRFSDKIVCVHHPHMEVLASRGASSSKAAILLNIPDPMLFKILPKSNSLQDGFRCVYHGTIARRLGIDIAVLAFAKVYKSHPKLRFDIYGDGDQSDDIEQLIKSIGLEQAVHFSKKMHRVEEVAQLVQGASLGIIANRQDPATEYMLPVKLLEYIFLKVPAVVPRLRTIQYYFGDEDVAYYRPGDIDDLACTLLSLIQDSERRSRLVRNASRFFELYSWEALKSELFRVVDSCNTPAH